MKFPCPTDQYQRVSGVELNRPGNSGDWFSESSRDGWTVLTAIVDLLVLGWGDVSEGFEKPSVIEPVDPFEGGEFDVLDAAPGPAAPDDLGFEQADNALGQGVVVGVTDAADGPLDAGLGKRSV